MSGGGGGGGGGGATRRSLPPGAWALVALGLLALGLAAAIVARRARGPARPGSAPIELAVEVHEPGAVPRRVDLRFAPASIGRDGSRDVVLRDPKVSRLHARIAVEGGRVWIEDAGSTGGLTVDGRPTRRAELRRGAEVVLGDSRLRIL